MVPTDPWAAHLGIEMTDAGDPTTFTMELQDEHLNFLDGAHGGALFSLAEAALRGAARQDGEEPELVDAHLSLVAGGVKGDVFTATVHPVKVGRTLGVYRVAVFRSDGKPVGELTGTVRFSP